jgi:hypothetical protein
VLAGGRSCGDVSIGLVMGPSTITRIEGGLGARRYRQVVCTHKFSRYGHLPLEPTPEARLLSLTSSRGSDDAGILCRVVGLNMVCKGPTGSDAKQLLQRDDWREKVLFWLLILAKAKCFPSRPNSRSVASTCQMSNYVSISPPPLGTSHRRRTLEPLNPSPSTFVLLVT